MRTVSCVFVYGHAKVVLQVGFKKQCSMCSGVHRAPTSSPGSAVSGGMDPVILLEDSTRSLWTEGVANGGAGGGRIREGATTITTQAGIARKRGCSCVTK
jgi:hypothetical protein